MNKMLNISLMALAFASASLNVSAQADAATPAQQKADVDLDAKYAQSSGGWIAGTGPCHSVAWRRFGNSR